jgi:phage terminase small subunit
MRDELTDKQRLFVTHYVACLNATRAAELARYEGNRITLAAIGYENLRKPQIRAASDARQRGAGPP